MPIENILEEFDAERYGNYYVSSADESGGGLIIKTQGENIDDVLAWKAPEELYLKEITSIKQDSDQSVTKITIEFKDKTKKSFDLADREVSQDIMESIKDNLWQTDMDLKEKAVRALEQRALDGSSGEEFDGEDATEVTSADPAAEADEAYRAAAKDLKEKTIARQKAEAELRAAEDELAAVNARAASLSPRSSAASPDQSSGVPSPERQRLVASEKAERRPSSSTSSTGSSPAQSNTSYNEVQA